MSTHGNRFPDGLCYLVVVVAFLFYNCGGLPDDFEALAVEEKVAAYEKHWKKGGLECEWARMHIAWHGWEAADLMAQYVTGEKRGIPRREAFEIISRVQERGCSLQGTAAESAVEDYLKTAEGFSAEVLAARHTIRVIRENHIWNSGNFYLKGGPCQP